MARRPPPPPATGLPPAFLAIAVLLVAAVAVVFLVSQMKAPAEDEPVKEEVDPFAKVPDELPPGVKSDPFGAEKADGGAGDPFADAPTTIKAEQLWKDAKEIAEEGLGLSAAAGEAKAAGDNAQFKELGKQAKEKLEKALDLTRDWEHGLAEEYGPNHPDVKSITRTRSTWRNQLVALKKTVGM